MPVYLPRDDDYPDLDSAPEVIQINGKCYEKIALSGILPTHKWIDVDQEYESCEECQFTSIEYLDCCPDLVNQYVVTLSGFPALYTLDTFNGSWTVTDTGSSTIWIYDITAAHRVSLYKNAGDQWFVGWSVNSPGGSSGTFGGTCSCAPINCNWFYLSCTEPFPAPLGLACPTIQSDATAEVSNVP